MKIKFLLVLGLIIIGLILFFHKTYLDKNLICKIDDATEFRPDAYVVINSSEKFNDVVFLVKGLGRCGDNFDFSKSTYVIVFGRKASTMYYSYKTTFFDDISDHYAPKLGSDVLFIDYEAAPGEKGIFVYEVPKNENLREFFGV